MSTFSSLLVPLDGSQMAARSLGCATWLATRLDARLHVLSASTHPLPAREELERLRVPESEWARVTLHHTTRLPEEEILGVADRHGIELIVMSAQGEAKERSAPTATPLAAVGHVARNVIGQSNVPVLLLPVAYRERLPWTQILVPVSGEIEEDSAASLAIALANDLALRVRIVHVLDGGSRHTGLAATRYADAAHHEYPERLAELVRRTVPAATPEECRCITSVALLRGEVAGELLAEIQRSDACLVVIGWHGTFAMGHAEVVKRLLATITCPMLLVKPSPAQGFRLRVGSDLA